MIIIFLDRILDMKFLKGKHGDNMNQNFEPFSGDMKEALDAIEQAAIGLGTCILLEHRSVGTFPKFFTYTGTKLYTNYIVLLQ